MELIGRLEARATVPRGSSRQETLYGRRDETLQMNADKEKITDFAGPEFQRFCRSQSFQEIILFSGEFKVFLHTRNKDLI
jgi:hypothetical protein